MSGKFKLGAWPRAWSMLLLASLLLAGCGGGALRGDAGAPLPAPGPRLDLLTVEQVAPEGDWGNRHGVTRWGKVLYFDSGGNVYLSDGSSATLVQAFDGGDPTLGGIEDTVFALGSGAAVGEVVGAWRRGTDFAWVWAGPGVDPVLVEATNPIDPAEPMNPEAAAIADGCIFMILQAFSGGTAVKHVFEVDAASGVATNLSGTAPAPGASRVTTSGCLAAWVFDDGSGSPELHFYDGTSIETADSGDILHAFLRDGRLVYEKDVDGVSQVFLYDSTVASPAPVQLSSGTAAGSFYPQTDGQHVAWLQANADGTNAHIVVNGGLALTDEATRPADLSFAQDFPYQLQRGQLLWEAASGGLRYFSDAAMSRDGSVTVDPVDISPARAASLPWLADGSVAFLDGAVYRFGGTPPGGDSQPAPPMLVLAMPGEGRVSVAWDEVLGASSYNLYLAEEPGVGKDNFQGLEGGRRIDDVTSPFDVTGLDDKRYYFAVTTVSGSSEGPGSIEASAIPLAAWQAAGGLSGVDVFALAVDEALRGVAYAAGVDAVAGPGVYKTVDGGGTWTPLAGGIDGRDVRALAARDGRVYANARDGDLLRSTDGGASWTVVADGADVGEQIKSLAIDPHDSDTLYAGNFQLPGYDFSAGHSLMIKSTDGGDTWTHVQDLESGEIHAYVIALDPVTAGTLYAGGSGVPVVKSEDGGQSWSDLVLPANFVYSLALEPETPATLYAGTQADGIYRSLDGGASWSQKTLGIDPAAGAVRVLLPDPDLGGVVYAGTEDGAHRSSDEGEHWLNLAGGLTGETVYSMALTSTRQLLAATSDGIFRMDLATEDAGGPSPDGTADLALSKSAEPNPVRIDSDLVYTLTATNYGPGTAVGVTVTDTLPGGVSFVSATSGAGTCNHAGGVVTCHLGDLAAAATASIELTVTPLAAGSLTNSATASSEVTDPEGGNDSGTVDVTVTTSSVSLTVAAGANPPAAEASALGGETGVPVLQFRLSNSSAGAARLESIEVEASGTGDDAGDISAVHLYLDVNGNGSVDAGDTALAATTFDGDDGRALLALSDPLELAPGDSETLLLSYDFANTLASVGVGLAALLPLALAALARRRRYALGAVLALLLVAGCRSTPPPGQSLTYRAELTSGAVAATDEANEPVAVFGLPLGGATVTVQR